MSDTIPITQFPRNSLADAARDIGREIDTATNTPVAEPAPRLCIECRWCIGTDKYAECGAPQNLRNAVDLVTGEHKIEPVYRYCTTHRTSKCPDTCGTSARWFADKGSARGEA